MTVSVVCFGGGHGLYASLRALNHLKKSDLPHLEITAIVGVSDDGGSSGRLRSEFPIVPPGDLRMALAALCPIDSSEGGDARVESLVQFRFDANSDSSLAGHVVGNIVLTALWSQGYSTVEGLDYFGRLLKVVGTVLPASVTPTVIRAEVRDEFEPDVTREISGQVAVATSLGEVLTTKLEPRDTRACPEALDRIAQADVLVFGPGSWFTSVTPHLLIPEMRSAIAQSDATKILILNLSPQPGETSHFDPSDYLESWSHLAPEIAIDTVIADKSNIQFPDRFSDLMQDRNISVVWHPLAASSHAHDPKLLAQALGIVLGMNRGTTWQ